MKKIILIIIAAIICGGGITAVVINNNNKKNEPVASSNEVNTKQINLNDYENVIKEFVSGINNKDNKKIKDNINPLGFMYLMSSGLGKVGVNGTTFSTSSFDKDYQEIKNNANLTDEQIINYEISNENLKEINDYISNNVLDSDKKWKIDTINEIQKVEISELLFIVTGKMKTSNEFTFYLMNINNKYKIVAYDIKKTDEEFQKIQNSNKKIVVDSYNNTFNGYLGENQKGSIVKNLIRTVYTKNIENEANKLNVVIVIDNIKYQTQEEIRNCNQLIKSTSTYKVEEKYNSDGYITEIDIITLK